MGGETTNQHGGIAAAPPEANGTPLEKVPDGMRRRAAVLKCGSHVFVCELVNIYMYMARENKCQGEGNIADLSPYPWIQG